MGEKKGIVSNWFNLQNIQQSNKSSIADFQQINEKQFNKSLITTNQPRKDSNILP